MPALIPRGWKFDAADYYFEKLALEKNDIAYIGRVEYFENIGKGKFTFSVIKPVKNTSIGLRYRNTAYLDLNCRPIKIGDIAFVVNNNTKTVFPVSWAISVTYPDEKEKRVWQPRSVMDNSAKVYVFSDSTGKIISDRIAAAIKEKHGFDMDIYHRHENKD